MQRPFACSAVSAALRLRRQAARRICTAANYYGEHNGSCNASRHNCAACNKNRNNHRADCCSQRRTILGGNNRTRNVNSGNGRRDLFIRYGYLAIPVVDNEYRLVGIVTVDDVLDVIEEEATEDIERMGGVIDTTDKEYLDQSVFQHVKARLPWLFLLMCSYFITGGILRSFEDAMSAVIELVIYMPMLMGTGGNSGSQSSTLVIRGMATGEIELRDFIKVMWKEIRVGVIVGVCLSILNYFRIVYLDHNPPMVAITVCVSMILIVIIAKLIGSMLPMVAKRIGIDPALMAGPMMASITDMISLCTYFIMAGLFLHI